MSLPTDLLIGAAFPRAPVLAPNHDHTKEPAESQRGTVGRLRVTATPQSADIISRASFPTPQTKGTSAEHGLHLVANKCRGIGGRGRRPIR